MPRSHPGSGLSPIPRAEWAMQAVLLQQHTLSCSGTPSTAQPKVSLEGMGNANVTCRLSSKPVLTPVSTQNLRLAHLQARQWLGRAKHCLHDDPLWQVQPYTHGAIRCRLGCLAGLSQLGGHQLRSILWGQVAGVPMHCQVELSWNYGRNKQTRA